MKCDSCKKANTAACPSICYLSEDNPNYEEKANQKVYVIQERVRPWIDKWKVEPQHRRFKTVDEARSAMLKSGIFSSQCRIAEEYTVTSTRYKVVKY